MLSTEAHRSLSLLHKSVNATLALAWEVDLRTVPKDKRETVREAREHLDALSDELAGLLAEAEEAAA